MPSWLIVALVVLALALAAFILVIYVRRKIRSGLMLPGNRRYARYGRRGIFGPHYDGLDLSDMGARPEVAEPSPDITPADVSMRHRLSIFGAGIGVAFTTLLVRLWGLQLVAGNDYEQAAVDNLTREVTTRAPRGRILDRNGNTLVGNRASLSLVADADVANDVRVVRRLSNLLGMPEVAVRRAIQNSTESAQAKRTIMLDVPDHAIAYVVEHPNQFPGVEVEARSVRTYPNGSLAAHLLGYTGLIASNEELESFQNGTSGANYVYGDNVGKSGIEYQYEGVLQGVRGIRTVHVTADGSVTGVVSEIPAVPGNDIRLTIDIDVQRAAEEALIAGIEAGEFLKYKPTGGAAVAMNCKTGEILALASNPTFEPSSFISGLSVEAWAQIQAAESNTPLLNRVINGLYPTASTIKPFSTLAALEHGVAQQSSVYNCPGFWTGFGEAYGMFCWKHEGHDDISLRQGIVVSCDAVFYEIAKSFFYSDEPEALQEMFVRWGLGRRTGVDLPGETEGRIPDAEWKWDWYTWADDRDHAWQGGDTANIAIGQGDILVTPMQLAYAFSSLANGGHAMWPHVLLDVISSQTRQTITSTSPHVAVEVPVAQSDYDFVINAMGGVVNETNYYRYFDGLPVNIGGKSGTCEAGDDPENPHALFVAFAPLEDPEYVVVAVVEHGGAGGYVASNVCRGILGAIYGVGPLDAIELLATRSADEETIGD